MLRGLFALIFYFLQKKLAKPAKLCYTYRAVMCCYSSVGKDEVSSSNLDSSSSLTALKS